MQVRDQYEMCHLGNFKRVFPSESEDLQDKYEMLLQYSQKCHKKSKQLSQTCIKCGNPHN